MDGSGFQVESALMDTPATGAAKRTANPSMEKSDGALPAVTMMETAHPSERHDLRSVARVVLNGTPIGMTFAQPIWRPDPNDNSEGSPESVFAGAVRSAESHSPADLPTIVSTS